MKQNTILLRFYEELNDFLSLEKRKIWFECHFSDNPTIKDIIESMGVPPSEVDLILVNGQSVNFSYAPKNDDKVSIYPVFESFDISTVSRLRAQPLRDPKFILDAPLGKLTKYLRLLGFDALYQDTESHDFSPSSIDQIGKKDKRIILTRDKNVLKKKIITHGYLIKAVDPKKQVEEVISRFDLFSKIKPFSLCLKCNVKIVPIEKNKIANKLPSIISRHFNKFTLCPQCKRIYWQDIHYQTMVAFVRQIKKRKKLVKILQCRNIYITLNL